MNWLKSYSLEISIWAYIVDCWEKESTWRSSMMYLGSYVVLITQWYLGEMDMFNVFSGTFCVSSKSHTLFKTTLIQLMAWNRAGDAPLPYAMLTQFTYACEHSQASMNWEGYFFYCVYMMYHSSGPIYAIAGEILATHRIWKGILDMIWLPNNKQMTNKTGLEAVEIP